jgi:subtilisin family serine protease
VAPTWTRPLQAKGGRNACSSVDRSPHDGCRHLGGIGSARAQKFRRSAAPIAGEYIVVLVEPTPNAVFERQSALTEADALVRTYFGTPGDVWEDALLGMSASMFEASAKAVSADPRVAYVEENAKFTAATTEYGVHWNLERVDQRPVPNPYVGQYTYNLTGAGVHVYVLDTGIRATHTEFTGRIGDGINYCTTDGNGLQCHMGSPYFCSYSNDCENHGTIVGGIIAGTIYGIAKAAVLHSVRVIDSFGNGTSATIINGVNWVATHHTSPAVANISIDGPIGGDSGVDDAIQGLHNYGVTVIVAAGNGGADACNYSPPRAPAAITVGGTTSSDGRHFTSNYGSCLDIFAPGEDVLSASSTGDSATNALLGAQFKDGTSFAAPHVSGVVALYLSQVGYVPPSTVSDFLILNATTPSNQTGFTINNAGAGSPIRLLHARWSKHWFYLGQENCYDEFGKSCYSIIWNPACPPRPVKVTACTTTGATCWSVVNSSYVEEYQCSGTN